MTQNDGPQVEWWDIDPATFGLLTRRVSADDYPPVFYHYTKTEGLIGIVRTGSLWASHETDLNDEGEYSYREEIIRMALDECLTDASDAERRGIVELQAWTERVTRSGFLPKDDYVVSFSAQRDHLSQWERYSGVHGYAIGFRGLQMTYAFGAAAQYMLMPVYYELDLQVQVLRDAIRMALAQLNSRISEEDFEKRFGLWSQNTNTALRLLCRSFKHVSFKDEAEWRASRTVYVQSPEPIHFRSGEFGVVPYQIIGLRLKELKLISEMMIARTHYYLEAKRSLELLLQSSGYDLATLNISHSEVPLRN